jgi:3-dehydroquinate synthase
MRLRVETGAAPVPGGYDVVVERGALHRLPALAAAAVDASGYALIADSTVASLYAEPAAERLRAAGRTARVVSFAPGEANKTRATWATLTDTLADSGLDRDGCVLAVGGGVTTDLAGFVAATYMRGLPVLHVPTTLLAMIDAAIGGKTGVDTAGGKNLVGSFHQPRLVLVDPATLETLPHDILLDGLAEAIKHGAIADATLLEWLTSNAAALLRRDADVIDALIARSIAIKVGIVSRDPLEQGARAVLNFGHTFAHALERVTDYTVPHGRAVAIGLVVEAAIGEASGITEPGTAHRIARVLAAFGLPHALPAGLDAAALMAVTARDKKARGGAVRYVLLERVGACARDGDGRFTSAVEPELVATVLRESAAAAAAS